MYQQNLRMFDVYQHPQHGYQAVRHGFSWLAFLLPSVWAVGKGLGMLTLVFIVATTAAFDFAQLAGYVASHPLSQVVIMLALLMLVGIKPGFDGYRWQARALRDEGFEKVDSLVAANARSAIRAAKIARPGAAAMRLAY
jgi:hypothetical protein